MKRAADGSAKGSEPAMAGAAASDQKSDPIPRPFKINSVTLHFNQRTWEEIGSGQLKFLPLCMNLFYMLDAASLNLFKKYKGLWSTMEIHDPYATCRNILMLQDEMANKGGTPSENSIYTQACYFIKYTPTRESLFFNLIDMKTCEEKKTAGDMYNMLTYNLNSTKCDADDVSQLVNLINYTDFEKLGILTAKVDEFAGFEPRGLIRRDVNRTFSNIQNTFIPPNRLIGKYAQYSANLQPPRDRDHLNVVKPFKQVTWARNLDKISIYKYGDTVELPITTNLNGVKLLNSAQNDFTNRQDVIIDKDESGQVNSYLYETEFCWPSRNRPYYTRKDNLNEIAPMETAKNMGQLKYHFLTMPPIRKANGSLLKQRVSFMLEQSFSVTLNFPESVWDTTDDDDVPTSANLLNQSDGVILRPLLYGTLLSEKKNEGAIGYNNFTCDGKECPYDNSFSSLISLWIDYAYSEGGKAPWVELGTIDDSKDFLGFTCTGPFTNADIYM